MDRFTSMALFARVVERGSFAAAAEGSGMTPTMVGNHVRELERHLHGRLLNRTTRRQSLTELGKRFHARCIAILAPVESAELDAREMRASPRGRLRVSCPITYGTHALMPVLANYLNRYPDVQVELSLNDRFIDLARDGFDAAIRVGELPDSGLMRAAQHMAWRIVHPVGAGRGGRRSHATTVQDSRAAGVHSRALAIAKGFRWTASKPSTRGRSSRPSKDTGSRARWASSTATT